MESCPQLNGTLAQKVEKAPYKIETAPQKYFIPLKKGKYLQIDSYIPKLNKYFFTNFETKTDKMGIMGLIFNDNRSQDYIYKLV